MLKKVVQKFAIFIFVYIFVRSIRHNNKTNAMKKDEILELIRNKEQELYEDLQKCKTWYGVDHKHTRYALGAWGAVLNLLQTIEENEIN